MAFWQLTVPTAPETSEAFTNFLWEQGALGVVEEEVAPEPPRLRAFFPETASSTGLLRAVAAYQDSLGALGLPAGGEPEIAPLHDEAWASAWQQSFPPRAVGRRLLVLPPWLQDDGADPARADGRCVVVIEPGRAFGTGHHGSTEGCLALLDEAAAPVAPGRVLDIGTGTGILAVAAVKLGAASVLALDVDPDAIAAAERSARRNGCESRIALRLARPDAVVGEDRFSLVLANLLSHAHLGLMPRYAELLAPGGRLILGGLLTDEEAPVIDAAHAHGLELEQRVARDGWSSLLLRAARP